MMTSNNSNPLKDLEGRLRSRGNDSLTVFADDVVEIVDQYKNMLKKIEWIMDDQWEEEFCPVCLGWKKTGHEEDCELGNMLAE
jgi:hypothetical protein